MSVGPHVFGRNRRGLWVANNANLTDKLKHYLPRLRNAIPNLPDVFLPPEAGPSHKDILRQNDFFVHGYDVARDRTPPRSLPRPRSRPGSARAAGRWN